MRDFTKIKLPSDIYSRQWQWYNKINVVIASCNNGPQIMTARALIELFYKRYKDNKMKSRLTTALIDRSTKI